MIEHRILSSAAIYSTFIIGITFCEPATASSDPGTNHTSTSGNPLRLAQKTINSDADLNDYSRSRKTPGPGGGGSGGGSGGDKNKISVEASDATAKTPPPSNLLEQSVFDAKIPSSGGGGTGGGSGGGGGINGGK